MKTKVSPRLNPDYGAAKSLELEYDFNLEIDVDVECDQDLALFTR